MRKKEVGGGGFLANVDATIRYEFTAVAPVSKKPGAAQAPREATDFRPLFVKLLVDVDNVEETQETSLMFGDATEWTISKDKQTITPESEEAAMWAGKEFDLFLNSYIEKGIDEALVPTGDPGEQINFEDVFDGERRVRLVQLKRTDKWAEENPRTYKDKRTGKTKTVARTYLAVGKILGEADRAGRPTLATMTASRSSAAKHGKTNGETADAEDIAAISERVLKGILKAAKGTTVKYSDLKLKVTTYLQGREENALRAEIRAYLEDEDNLAHISDVLYDASDKTRPIKLL